MKKLAVVLLVFISTLMYSQTVLFGNQNIETGVDFNAVGTAQAWQYTAIASGLLAQLRVYVDTGSTASSGQVGVYSDANGFPGTRLTVGTVTNPRGNGWLTVTVSPTINVTSGTRYWIAMLGTGSGLFKYRNNTSTTACSSGSGTTGLTSLPASYNALSNKWGRCPMSAYGVSGAAPPPPITVTINPVSTAVSLGSTIQFTATVNNSTNQNVTWSYSQPAPGGITSNGLFTAPSATITVKATSVADPTKSAMATVTLEQDVVVMHKVTLQWDASPTAGVTYNLYKGTTSGGEVAYQSNLTGSPFVDAAISPSTTYFYRLRAFLASNTANNESVDSNEAVAVIP